jgi:hypothetical protein
LLLIGVVQVYMERIMSMGYLDSQSALIPLYTLWIVTHLLWGIGFAMYANRYLGAANHLMEAA